MVIPDEQRALQLANAEADERFWLSLRDMNEAQAEGHKGLAGTAEASAANLQTAAADAAAKAAAAKDRAERIKRGEDVPGGLHSAVIDMKRILREAGWTARDIEQAQMLAMLSESELKDELLPELHKAKKRVERSVTRRSMRTRCFAKCSMRPAADRGQQQNGEADPTPADVGSPDWLARKGLISKPFLGGKLLDF